MRVEDLDRARVPAGAEAQQLDDLALAGARLGRGARSRRPVRAVPAERADRPLRRRDRARCWRAGRAFPCACSRADVARAASAPHDDDEEPRYPGTCRDARPGRGDGARGGAGEGARDPLRRARRADRFRRRGPRRRSAADAGRRRRLRPPARRRDGRLPAGGGGRRRGDGGDARRARRRSALARRRARSRSTARSELPPPVFAHVPLVLTPGGERLAKRTRPASLASLRARGVAPEAVVGALAASAGLLPPFTSRPIPPPRTITV